MLANCLPQETLRPCIPGLHGTTLAFTEPDYYIHGTGATESLGEAASHGCLRMDPNDAAEVALMVMENGGVARDWDWVKGILGLGEQRIVTVQQTAPLTILP